MYVWRLRPLLPGSAGQDLEGQDLRRSSVSIPNYGFSGSRDGEGPKPISAPYDLNGAAADLQANCMVLFDDKAGTR